MMVDVTSVVLLEVAVSIPATILQVCVETPMLDFDQHEFVSAAKDGLVKNVDQQ